MKQKSNDVQNTDEMRKMSTLFNRASCSSSNREKNQLLTQLRAIALDCFSKYEKVVTRNTIREKELAGLQKNFEDLQKKLDITRMHLDQKIELEDRGIKSDKRTIISNIKKTEEELSSFGALERPNLLQAAIEREEKCEPHLAPILLWDIEMQRYEELVYALQKRIISVEENQECSEKILEEFGSVFGLIDEYKSLTIENEKLKKDESKFINDPVVRRRNNSNISIIAVRPLILSLQNELKKQNSLLTGLNKTNANETNLSSRYETNFFKKEDPVNKAISVNQDFDSMCQDPNFTMSTSVAVIRADQIEKPAEVELPPDKAVEEQKKNASEAKDQLKKVEDDLNNLRNSEIKVESSAGSRCKKLFELNHRLFDQIQALHEKIDSYNEEALVLLKRLNEMMAIRNAYQLRTSSIFEPYQNLLHDFFNLSGQITRNVQIDKTLSSTSSTFAKDVILEDAKEQPLFYFLNPILQESVKSLRLKSEEEKEKEMEREREREARKSSRNKNQKLDFQSIISNVQNSSRGQKEHIVKNPVGPPIVIPRSRHSSPMITPLKRLSQVECNVKYNVIPTNTNTIPISSTAAADVAITSTEPTTVTTATNTVESTTAATDPTTTAGYAAATEPTTTAESTTTESTTKTTTEPTAKTEPATKTESTIATESTTKTTTEPTAKTEPESTTAAESVAATESTASTTISTTTSETTVASSQPTKVGSVTLAPILVTTPTTTTTTAHVTIATPSITNPGIMSNANGSNSPFSPIAVKSNITSILNTGAHNSNTHKHAIKFLPLPIQQTETTKHHHQSKHNQQLQLLHQQQLEKQQQLIEQMKQYKLPRILIASLLTRLAETSSFIFKKENISHQSFISTWKALESHLRELLNQKMTEFEVDQRHLISQVQYCGNKILVKELKEIETMTLPVIKVDIETQYEEQKKKPIKKK